MKRTIVWKRYTNFPRIMEIDFKAIHLLKSNTGIKKTKDWLSAQKKKKD